MLLTKDLLISEVILRLTQGKPSNDLELEKEQVAFELDKVRWKLITERINKLFAAKHQIDPIYIYTEDALLPELLPITGVPVQDNVQVTLEYMPLNLYRDRGVIRVFASPIQSTSSQPNLALPIDYGSQVEMITASDLDVIKNLKFSKPSLTSLKYRREGNVLKIYGLDANTYKMVQFSVTYFPRLSLVEDLNETDIVPLTEDLYDQLIEETVAKLKEQVGLSIMDVNADAVQNSSSVSVNKTNK